MIMDVTDCGGFQRGLQRDSRRLPLTRCDPCPRRCVFPKTGRFDKSTELMTFHRSARRNRESRAAIERLLVPVSDHVIDAGFATIQRSLDLCFLAIAALPVKYDDRHQVDLNCRVLIACGFPHAFVSFMFRQQTSLLFRDRSLELQQVTGREAALPRERRIGF